MSVRSALATTVAMSLAMTGCGNGFSKKHFSLKPGPCPNEKGSPVASTDWQEPITPSESPAGQSAASVSGTIVVFGAVDHQTICVVDLQVTGVSGDIAVDIARATVSTPWATATLSDAGKSKSYVGSIPPGGRSGSAGGVLIHTGKNYIATASSPFEKTVGASSTSNPNLSAQPAASATGVPSPSAVFHMTGATNDGTTESVDLEAWPIVPARGYTPFSGFPAAATCGGVSVDIERDGLIPVRVKMTNTSPAGFSAKVEFALYDPHPFPPKYTSIIHDRGTDVCSQGGSPFAFFGVPGAIASGSTTTQTGLVVVTGYYSPEHPKGDVSNRLIMKPGLELFYKDNKVTGPTTSPTGEISLRATGS